MADQPNAGPGATHSKNVRLLAHSDLDAVGPSALVAVGEQADVL